MATNLNGLIHLCNLMECIFDILKLYSLIQQIQHSLKHLRSTTLGCKDIVIRKAEFVTKHVELTYNHLSILFDLNQAEPFEVYLNVELLLAGLRLWVTTLSTVRN